MCVSLYHTFCSCCIGSRLNENVQLNNTLLNYYDVIDILHALCIQGSKGVTRDAWFGPKWRVNREALHKQKIKPWSVSLQLMTDGSESQPPPLCYPVYTAISKNVGGGFVASCIPSPKCTMGDVHGVSERSQQYGLWEFSQTLSSQYGASIFSSSLYVHADIIYKWSTIHFGLGMQDARCNKTFTNLFWNSSWFGCARRVKYLQVN